MKHHGVYLGQKRGSTRCPCGLTITEYRDYDRKVAHLKHGDTVQQFPYAVSKEALEAWLIQLHTDERRRAEEAQARRAGAQFARQAMFQGSLAFRARRVPPPVSEEQPHHDPTGQP